MAEAPQTDLDDLLAQARAWADEDPDDATRAELLTAVDAVAGGGDHTALADAFVASLAFGTAGLRGALGAGPNRMNRVVVTRAAAGLAAYLLEQGATQGDRVVIGYDARHNSDVFARDTAEVMTGVGLRALVLPGPLPTPVLAYAIRDLGAVAGVMVTASHNPPQDNGYKVYLGDGGQIVSPADVEIAAHIAAVGRLADVPRGSAGEVIGDDLLDRYLARVASLVDPDGPRDITVVHTALHGVGDQTVRRALRLAGFPEPHVVAEQAAPDPAFPTVAFPNPEEPGAMDLAMARAAAVGADLVIANDPDADRCAVAVPVLDPLDHQGGWRMLRGDEVGALLADFLLQTGVRGTFACSIVSSSLLARIAAARGVASEETLTGFKWISRVPDLAFGYEEALGYCVDPSSVRDKDGVSAAVRIVELAALLKAQGRTLEDRLAEIAAEHGVHATDQLSVRVADLQLIATAMAGLRSDPPTTLGGLAVALAEDLALGVGGLPPTDGLRYQLTDPATGVHAARVIVRPSGTEPKVKCYLEAVVPVAGAVAEGESTEDAVGAARIVAAGRLDALRHDLAPRLGA